MDSDSFDTPILFQNQDRTVTLLDLPLSISFSQNSSKEFGRKRIVSSKPLEAPFPSIDPKSEKARKNVLLRTGPLDEEHLHEGFIEVGLREIKKHHKGRWCRPRHVSTSPLPEKRCPKKRAANSVPQDDTLFEEILEPDTRVNSSHAKYQGPLALNDRPANTTFKDIRAISNRVISHSGSACTKISISSPTSEFHIPGRSAFFLANINRHSASAWSRAVLKHYPTSTASAGPGQVDCVLLDPPWQNRSVRRSKRYDTMREQDPMIALKDTLGRHLAPNALVGCWITNSRSARIAALEAFEAWGVELSEEWIWLKVTGNGEPVYDLQGHWRKPYETLLVGRLLDNHFEQAKNEGSEGRTIKRRLIVAVPDFHSRKPNLKHLVEPFLPDKDTYRALEIFARNLTSGWFAWGNEVLKFNWEGHWTDGG